MTQSVSTRIAADLDVPERQVSAAVNLLDEGATVPFVARYRKEVTGGLDDVQLRRLEERLTYLRELDERRTTVLATIVEQGQMTAELERAIQGAASKVELEDLYRPYKKKRRTKAQVAREAGLEPLARGLLDDPTQTPDAVAAAFVAADRGVADVEAALEGARQILMEDFADDPELVGQLRKRLASSGFLVARVVKGKEQEGERFRDYFAHDEPLSNAPSHRTLAMLRGRNEGVLRIGVGIGEERELLHKDPGGVGQAAVQERFGIADRGRPADAFLTGTARLAFVGKLATHLETDAFSGLRERAESEAIEVFAANLRDLLLAAPAGPKTILGLDPGLRTGVKVAIVDRTGKVCTTATIYPHVPRNDWIGSIETLARLCREHEVSLVSIGNGTGSRETDKLVGELAKAHPEFKLQRLVVSEAGASVYSASEFASREFPDMDVSLRGAVSIARRLQDPLAELVKIDPKAIGVGQYQHDVNQSQLARSLGAVIEDCVNTASEPLLERVAGLSSALAHNIVAHRDQNGVFTERKQLLEVARLGPKAFEQAAGFLRIPDGKNPLDASGVHPEAYPVVERILSNAGKKLGELIGDRELLGRLDPKQFADEKFGVPTVTDILAELEKPGRDPRPEFKTATFEDGVEKITDLRLGMILEGVVSNVTNFGAFVDIGVHQDGLAHISQLSNQYVEDPRDVVKAGQVVRVKVLEIDVERRRIALTLRLQETPESAASSKRSRSESRTPGRGIAAGGLATRGFEAESRADATAP